MTTRSDKVLTGERNQCPGCGEHFNSNTAFDKHRIGEHGVKEGPTRRRCMTPEEMITKGMSINPDGFWVSRKMDPGEVVRRREKES